MWHNSDFGEGRNLHCIAIRGYQDESLKYKEKASDCVLGLRKSMSELEKNHLTTTPYVRILRM